MKKSTMSISASNSSSFWLALAEELLGAIVMGILELVEMMALSLNLSLVASAVLSLVVVVAVAVVASAVNDCFCFPPNFCEDMILSKSVVGLATRGGCCCCCCKVISSALRLVANP